LAARSGVEAVNPRILAVRDKKFPRQVLARRNPLLVLRFIRVFLLRFAEQTFAG